MLITPEYLKTQADAHEDANYGNASIHYAPLVSQFIDRLKVAEVLDYGAGKCELFKHLRCDHPLRLQAYDPAIPSLAGRPSPSQMVVCLDVLEHVEPECLDGVLDDLQSLTLELGLFSVCTMPAMRTLSDGRNAHLIVEDSAWWLPKIQQRWELELFQKIPHGFLVMVSNGDHEPAASERSALLHA